MGSQAQAKAKPMSPLDGLYCEEGHFEEDLGFGYVGFEAESETIDGYVKSPLALSELDLYWENDELVSLLSKERETHLGEADLGSDGSVMVARTEAVEWILRVIAHFGFSALTTVLAVYYFDRFKSSFCFDKPWKSQLAAVACLSLAAKVEETQVPLLVDLQVEGSKYVFEAKTIQRMELLVLSTLQWRMNPVTPISFFDHIVRRLGLKTHLHFEFLWRCERLILSVITDSRYLSYLPSELATVTMLHVLKEVEPCNALEYQNQLMGVIKINKDKMDDCYKLILELSDNNGHNQSQTHKRKYQAAPGSPNGVIDAYFSCDSSNDSWDVTSSPERVLKKSRHQDQQMRLARLNHLGVLGDRG